MTVENPSSVLPIHTQEGAAADPSLEHVARPLLLLIQHLTGMESSFLTSIDWDGQTQEVLFSLNTGGMQIPEGNRVDWHDSMCRSMFLDGRSQTNSVGVEVPATPGALALSMKSFFAVPILAGGVAIGTVCGASERDVVLSADQMLSMQFVAGALTHLLWSERANSEAEARANQAELLVRDAHLDKLRQARDLARMEVLAHVDLLTGLPNRRAFTARWEDELARSARRGYSIGLILIDADRFKSVNDASGHLAGDSVLGAIGASLLEVAETADIAARLGGDEFALARTHTDVDGLLALAEAVRQRFKIRSSELGMQTTLSFGVASSDNCPRHDLLADADKALYRSKAAGGDCIELFACADLSVTRTT